MHFGAEDGHHGLGLGQLKAATGPQAGALGVCFAELVLSGQVAGVVAGVEAEVWGPPIGADGTYWVLDEEGSLTPGGEAGGPLEQLQGFDDAAEALAAEMGTAGNGGVGARREERGEGHGAVGRQPLAHVGPHADDVTLAGFAGWVLQVDAVAEVAGISPRLHKRGGEVEAADDDGKWHDGGRKWLSESSLQNMGQSVGLMPIVFRKGYRNFTAFVKALRSQPVRP